MLKPEDVSPELKEAYEAGREYGRWEVDTAGVYSSFCLNCAIDYDRVYNDSKRGYLDGIRDAIYAIENISNVRPFKSQVLHVLENLSKE